MYVLYKGPSVIDGGPIVVIASGYINPSKNAKTGPMIQVYILRADMLPKEAIKENLDESICGDCIHRNGSCYVQVFRAPNQIYKSWQKKNPTPLTKAEIRLVGKNRAIRLGAYGDPGAAPTWVWENLTRNARGYTGYTHLWKTCDPKLKNYCMASADSIEEAAHAQSEGWRTYRVKELHEQNTPLEISCPHSEIVKCETCLLCKGVSNGKNITIDIHGANWKQQRFSSAIRARKDLVILNANESREMPVHFISTKRAESTAA